MRRRIALLLAAITTLVVAVAVQQAPTAAASTCDHTQACWKGWDGFHAVGPNGSVPVTLAWLRNNIPGVTIGPSRATGYGKENLGSFTLGCPECSWYRVDRNLTNHQPGCPGCVATTGTGKSALAMKRRGGCWPWDDGFFSGSSCWNEPGTWDWGGIWDSTWNALQPDPSNWSNWNIWGTKCWNGVYQGGTFGIVGRQGIGHILGKEALVRISPEGFWYTILGGCAWQFFK